MSRKIFVFGSNTRGVHGAGAARVAHKQHGAIWGQGSGLQGDSYAIPTRRPKEISGFETLPLEDIQAHILLFKVFAMLHPELEFWVTRIGTGLAGYTDEQIAPLFEGSPVNVILPKQWGGEGFSE